MQRPGVRISSVIIFGNHSPVNVFFVVGCELVNNKIYKNKKEEKPRTNLKKM